MTEHTQHCDHEEFCRFFFHDSKIAVHDGTPCMRNHDGCAKCSYDSRTSATPTPAPEQIIHGCNHPDKDSDCEKLCKCIDCTFWEPRYPDGDHDAVCKNFGRFNDCSKSGSCINCSSDTRSHSHQQLAPNAVRKEEREPVSKLEKYPTYDLIYELLKRKEVRVKVIYQGENHTISNTLMGNWVLESPHELGFKKEIVIIFRGGLG
jgi:hypothetical protein